MNRNLSKSWPYNFSSVFRDEKCVYRIGKSTNFREKSVDQRFFVNHRNRPHTRGNYSTRSFRKLVTFQSRSTLKLFARVLHIGTSDERGGWFYATSVHILVGSPGARILFDETGVENPTLQIVSSCHQNTEPKGARATPRATSAVYNPAYS